MNQPTFLGPPVYADDDSDVHCMSLACEQKRKCTPTGMSNGRYIYPPDCATGARFDHRARPREFGNDMGAPLNPTAPVGGQTTSQSPGASSPAPFNLGDLGSFFGGMSTTTLLLLGGAAYFFFFKKGR